MAGTICIGKPRSHSLALSVTHIGIGEKRKGDMRRLWITRINAAARECGMSYSEFISGLSKASVSVDRKILADIAVRDSGTFANLVNIAKEGTTVGSV